MGFDVSANRATQLPRDSELRMFENLVSERMRNRTNLKMIQYALGALEYIVYFITFISLLMIKLIPEFPEISYWFWHWPGQLPVVDDYIWFLVCFLGLYLLITYQQQFYSTNKERSLSDEIVIIIRSISLSFLFTIGITFLIKNTVVYSRIVLVLFLLIIIVEASVFRYLRKWILFQLKRRGRLKQNILVIGAGRVGQQLQKLFLKSATSGLHFVGFLDDRSEHQDVIGVVDDLKRVVHTQKVDIIYITIPSERQKINPLLQQIYKYQIDIRIVPELFDRMSSIYEYRQDYDYPSLQIVKTPLRGLNQVLKRFMDISLSGFGILFLTPFLLFIAAAIKVTSRGPVIYKQKRMGKNGTPFTMFKFRSMIVDADQKQAELGNKNDSTGPVFKMKHDPRITRLGAYLRKYSIDELPQLFNVFVGEMSLIGPRPPLPEEVKQYSDQHWRRMDVRPGMTGLWQVSGRSDLTFDEWIDLDIQYIERWSIALEFKIMLKTIPVVIKGSGAY